MNRRIFKPWLAGKRGPLAVLAAVSAAAVSLAIAAGAGTAASAAPAAGAGTKVPGEAHGLGQLSGILPRAS